MVEKNAEVWFLLPNSEFVGAWRDAAGLKRVFAAFRERGVKFIFCGTCENVDLSGVVGEVG